MSPARGSTPELKATEVPFFGMGPTIGRMLIYVVGLCFGAVPAQAHTPFESESLSCERILVQLHQTLGNDLKTDNPMGKLPTEPTIDFIGPPQPGRYGGSLLRILKHGASWVSGYATVGYDRQGDPRWFIETIGKEAAEYFGFRMLSDNEMIVPDSIEFKGALSRLDAYLSRISPPIPVQFYTTPDNENVKVKDYVEAWARFGSIPLAPSGNHLIHDLSFHTGAIFLPPQLVRMKQITLRHLNAFLASEESKYAHQPQKLKAVRYYAYLLRMHETVNIDRATGLITPLLIYFMRHAENDVETIKNPAQAALSFLVNDGRDPTDYLDEVIGQMSPEHYNHHFSVEFSFAKAYKIEDLSHALELADFRYDFHQFNYQESVDEGQWEGFNFYRSRASVEYDKWCIWITQRRVQIRNAIQDLQRQDRTRPM